MLITYQFFSQTGKRANNEDSVLCSSETGIFILCDGVGGENKGEIISELVCRSISEYYSESEESANNENFIKATREVENQISEYVKINPESKGMATTLVFLQLSESAFIAHVGDSRLYYIRNGNIEFVTQDHSYVNELIASGFIKEEEARNHPKKNYITRAVQDKEHPADPDFQYIHNLKENDYFLLCSDGVMEAIDENFIKEFFTDNQQVEVITSKMKEICSYRSNDNNSAIIIKIIEMN